MADLAPSGEISKIPELIREFFDHVLYEEEPFFISDEAKIWDVSMAPTAEELLARCSRYYGIPVSIEDLGQPLWKLLSSLNTRRKSRPAI
jgi:hypothetical protein